MFIFFLSALAALFYPERLPAWQRENIKDNWQAQWIGPADRQLSHAASALENTGWIWMQSPGRQYDAAIDVPEGSVYFRRTLEIPDREHLRKAVIYISADDRFTLFVNGQKVTEGDSWEDVQGQEISQLLHTGTNVLAVEAENIEVGHTSFSGRGMSPAGLIARLVLYHSDGTTRLMETDALWRGRGVHEDGWLERSYADNHWQQALVLSKKGLTEWEGAGKDANTWYCFRKSFHLEDPPANAVAGIAVDSKYWLWINGKLVVFEGGLKRGPTPTDTYYDEVDLSGYLTRGENQVAVLVWYWGRNGYCHKSSGQPGLLFELDAGQEKICSDSSWKIKQHPAYGATTAPHPNYRLPEYNVFFDARQDIAGWQDPGFDDSKWRRAQTYGRPPEAPWNRLWKRPFPLWRDSGLQAYENDLGWKHQKDSTTLVMHLPRNITITPYFKVDGPPGHVIDIRTDNYIGGSEPNIRAEYITREGVQEFEALAYMNGHRVEYTIPREVKILELKYRETRFNTDFAGSFSCDDPFLNTLWMKARNTMNINMRDAIQDADRERAQWWGDAVIVLGEIFYSCDTAAYGLIRKAISNLVEWQKPDGVLFSPIPGKWEFELPLQMLASIGKYGFWRYYMYTGDSAMLRYAYPHVKRYLSLWKMGEDGLVVHRSGGWDWGDWGDNKDRPLMDNAWYAMALDAAIEIAKLSGAENDIPLYRERLASLRNNFDATMWNGNAYRSPGYAGATDDRGHGLAVVSGLSDPRLWPEVRNVLHNEFHASPYTEKYVLESFFVRRDAVGGLERMKKRYATMVNHPWCTTLWEGWGVGREGYGGGSYNHGWAGGPLILLSEYVGGVAPVEPGYAVYQVLPQLGPLRKVDVKVPSVRGTISVEHRKGSRSFSTTLVSPEGTEAIVGMPKDGRAAMEKVRVNGTVVWKEGRYSAMDGLDFFGEDAYFLQFKVRPGQWFFEAVYSDQ